MSKEQEELVDEVYNKYTTKYMGYEDIPSKELFLFEIKNNPEFSEKWGLKIEERDLSLEERMMEFLKLGISPSEFRKGGNYGTVIPKERTLVVFDTNNIPTKLITLTYNDKTIESYE
jgi:hypothetical protein